MQKTPPALPKSDDVEAAISRLSAYLPATPLVRSELLSRAFAADVWIKNETVSPVASFKWRGALNHLLLASGEKLADAVTFSSGNHGQGVAFAARLIGLKAHVFLPKNSNVTKARMIEAFGGTIHEVGRDINEAKDAAFKFAEDNRDIFVDDGESPDVMAGAATVGLEIVRQAGDIERIYVPMGAGNLAAGIGICVKRYQPNARIVAVQSEGAPAMALSFRARRSISHEISTIADGLVCREPANLALAGILAHVDEAVLVPDQLMLAAAHSLLIDAHLLAEPSAAAGLAAAWLDRESLRGRRVIIVVTGSNITRDHARMVLSSDPLIA